MATPATRNAGQTGIAITRDQALAAYRNMITGIPLAEDDDGSGLIADVLLATDIGQIGNTGSLPAGKDLVGKTVKVESMTRHESDQEDGLGWYLVVDAVDTDTGEAFKFQTSAGLLMATLVKLHYSDALPAIISIDKTVTRNKREALQVEVKAATGQLRLPGAEVLGIAG